MAESISTRSGAENDAGLLADMQLLDALKQAPAPLALSLGREHTYVYANAAMAEATGHHLTGRTVREAFPELGEFHALMDGVYATGKPYSAREVLVVFAREGGVPEDHWFNFVYEPLRDTEGNVTGILTQCLNVTEQVLARRSLEAVNKQLEDQALELEMANAELQEAASELEMQTEELQAAAADLEAQVSNAAAAKSAAEGAEQHLKVLANAIPALAWTAQPSGYIDWYNARWYEYTGTTPQEMEGWGWSSVHDPSVLDEVMEAWTASISTGDPFEMTFPLRGADGQFRHFLTRVMPVRDADGEVIRWFGTNTDVSGERQARTEAETRRAASDASAAQFRSLLKAIPVQVWTAKPDGGLDYVGETVATEFGVPAPELLGDGWLRFVHPDDAAAAGKQWSNALASGKPYEAEFRLRIADGSYRWHIARARPVKDDSGKVTGWVGSNTDVEDERQARAEAEAANRAKMEFLATMSHELRTPLNAIGGYAELIELGIHGPVTDEQRLALTRIQQSQRHLLGMINEVLNYSRLEAGALSYEMTNVPLREILVACVALVLPQALTKGIVLVELPCDPSLTVYADREKVQQIVLNLLSNAIKFTDTGSEVSIEGLSPEESLVLIRIRDTGYGIAPEHIDRIFHPFVQVDATLTRTREGTGLGLAISRDLARGMGGDLTVQSELGAGSTFTITLAG